MSQIDTRSVSPAALAIATSDGKWTYFPHLRYLQSQIMPVVLGHSKYRRICLSVPPQHGKSKFVSNWLARWIIGHSAAGKLPHMPDVNVAISSYNKDVAARFGEENRDWFSEWGEEIFGVRLSRKKFSRADWGIEGSDCRHYSVGLKGGLTSKKVDVMIVDDPFKDEDEARSFTQRERVWRWFGGVCNTRLSARGIVIVIQTRWHEDDLIGRIKKKQEDDGGEPWLHINLPALAPHEDEIAEDEKHLWFPDPLGRQPGEALCPELHPAEQIQEARVLLTEGPWWKIYQGSPRPGSGGIFTEKAFGQYGPFQYLLNYDPGRRCYYYRGVRKYDKLIFSVDCSWKDNARSDPVAIGVFATLGAEIFVLDVVCRRMSLDGTIEEIKRLKALYPMASAILIEDKANGPRVQQRIRTSVTGVVLRTPKGSKVERAEGVLHLVRGGNVLIPMRGVDVGAWPKKFMSELLSFPFGTHDDQVDMFTQALEYLEQFIANRNTRIEGIKRENSLYNRLKRSRVS